MLTRGSNQVRAALRDIFGVTLAGRNFRVFLILTFVSGAIVGPFAPFLPVYVHEKLGTTQGFHGWDPNHHASAWRGVPA